MKTIESTLRKEKEELCQIIKMMEKQLKNSPKGYLRIAQKKNRVEYYLRDKKAKRESGKERYLKQKELGMAKAIAQRDYDVSILKNAIERKREIERFLEKYHRTNLKEVYQKMHPCRRKLVNTVILSDEEYIHQWQNKEYEGKVFGGEEITIYTEKGERVRSKSEKIIADKLYRLGIPYRYEYPLLLNDHIKIYPDFTILKMPEREEVYLEHFGMMDMPEYVNNAVFKLQTYEKNRIYPGIKLFITYETGRSPLNVKTLEEMLKAVFVEE